MCFCSILTHVVVAIFFRSISVSDIVNETQSMIPVLPETPFVHSLQTPASVNNIEMTSRKKIRDFVFMRVRVLRNIFIAILLLFFLEMPNMLPSSPSNAQYEFTSKFKTFG